MTCSAHIQDCISNVTLENLAVIAAAWFVLVRRSSHAFFIYFRFFESVDIIFLHSSCTFISNTHFKKMPNTKFQHEMYTKAHICHCAIVSILHSRVIWMYGQLSISVCVFHISVCAYIEHIFRGKAMVCPWPVTMDVLVSRDTGVRTQLCTCGFCVCLWHTHYCRQREDVMASTNIPVFLEKASIKRTRVNKMKMHQ